MPWGLLVFGLWLAWLFYWIICAGGNKVTARRESAGSQLCNKLPLVCGIVLLAAHHAGVLSRRFVPPSPIFHGLGLMLLVLGLAFAVWARVHLGANWSAIVTLKRNHELIRTGPYRWVRHPIYSGLLLGILGTAITMGEWRGLAAFALVTLGFVLKLRVEERWMGEAFGEEYARYKREVPALVPGARLWCFSLS